MHRVLLLCSVLLAAVVLPKPVLGQDLISEEDQKKFDFYAKGTFDKLCRGEKEYNKADEKLVRQAAEYYVYTTTLARLAETGALPKHLTEFSRKIDSIVGVKERSGDQRKNYKFAEAFGKELVECFKEVFKADPMKFRIGYTNAATLLPSAGKLGEPVVCDFLGNLIKGKAHNIARLYAFKGMAEYYQQQPIKLNQATANKVRAQEAARIMPLIEFLQAPSGLSPTASAEEIDAHRYIRREAIQALAQVRWPCIPQGKGDGLGFDMELQAPVAHALLCVLSDGKTALNPPATFQEKFEAVIGICQLQAGQMPRYLPDAGVALVGSFLTEFGQVYRQDKNKFIDPQGSKKFIHPPMVPWRIYSARLLKALPEMVKNTPSGKAATNLENIVKNSTAMLDGVRLFRFDSEPGVLRTFVATLPRPGPAVYTNSTLTIDVSDWPPR